MSLNIIYVLLFFRLFYIYRIVTDDVLTEKNRVNQSLL